MHPPKPERLDTRPMNRDRLIGYRIRRTKIDRCWLVAHEAGQALVGVFLGEELGEFRVLQATAVGLGGGWWDGGEEDVGVH